MKSDECTLELEDEHLLRLPEIIAWLDKKAHRGYHLVYPPRRFGSLGKYPDAIHFNHIGDATMFKMTDLY